MRDIGWNGVSGARLAGGYLREDVLEVAQTPSCLEMPELPEVPGHSYWHLLGR